MRELTIQEVIKAIPLDDTVREEFLKSFDSYSPGKQYELTRLLWEGFHQMREAMIEAKYNEFMVEVSQGKKTFTTTFMNEVEDKVWEDIENIISGVSKDNQKLEAVRDQLQHLIKKYQ